MLNNVHGILMTNQPGYNLKDLSSIRSISSVPYGGRYRLVDFVLSNMVDDGITDIGVVLQQGYQSLLSQTHKLKNSTHMLTLSIVIPCYNEEEVLPDTLAKMEALIGLKDYLSEIKQEYLIVADADIVLNISLEDVFEKHIASGADVSVVCSKKFTDSPDYATYFTLKEDGSADQVLTRPEGDCYESLSIYVLSKNRMIELVDYSAARGLNSFSRQVLPLKDKLGLRVVPYLFQGYAARFPTVADYFAKSMDLLKKEVRDDLFNPAHPIRSKDRSDPAAYYGPESKVVGSMISDGCVIEGTVENSIIFRNVKIAKGAVVKNCILMKDVEVGPNASLNCVICDKSVSIGANRTLSGCETYPIVYAKGTKI